MDELGLRSEQVRRIIGQVPPLLVRSGIGVIAAVVALLLAATIWVPWPEAVVCEVEVSMVPEAVGDKWRVTGELPYAYITRVTTGTKTEIELEGYETATYGTLRGKVLAVCRDVVRRDGQNYFRIEMSIEPWSLLREGMKGRACVLLAERTLLERLLSRE